MATRSYHRLPISASLQLEQIPDPLCTLLGLFVCAVCSFATRREDFITSVIKLQTWRTNVDDSYSS